MKHFVLMLFGCLVSTWTSAQHLATAQLPQAVQRAFTRVQPQATHVSWHQNGTNYEATFRQHQSERRGVVRLTLVGEILETRLDVDYADFPPLGRTTMSQRFPQRQLDRLTKVVSASGRLTYVVQVCKHKDKNGKDKDCEASEFDESGRPLPK